MSREVHVRFWESAGVRFPRATRLPLNRLSRIFARWGGRISRATLCDWVMACADQLAPVVSHMRDEVLAADYVQTDDTRVLVKIPLARKGKKGNQTRMVQGYLWPYRADEQVVYDSDGVPHGFNLFRNFGFVDSGAIERAYEFIMDREW